MSRIDRWAEKPKKTQVSECFHFCFTMELDLLQKNTQKDEVRENKGKLRTYHTQAQIG